MKYYALTDYINLMNRHNLFIESNIDGDVACKLIKQLTFNSKACIDNTLFICKGATFKQDYLKEALEKGAVAYISDKKYEDIDAPYIIVSDIRLAMGYLANMFDNYPYKDLNITAVGGTKGKTTTAFFVKAIIDKHLQNIGHKPCGFLSSVKIFDGIDEIPSRRTTPEAVELQHTLRRCLNNNLSHVCMEISSQALKYHRVLGMRFATSIFLNIGLDHISPNEHADFDDYLNSKMKMFDISDKVVLNLDIDHQARILQRATSTTDVITYSKTSQKADYFIYDIQKHSEYTSFRLKSDDFDEQFAITMPGIFNIENVVAAIIVGLINNIPADTIRQSIYQVNPEGRMETYRATDDDIICIVDYAHNGFSFEKLFESIKSEYPQHHLRVVFGMPGDKAYTRRSETGDISGKYADDIILTSDDPAHENPQDICEEIAKYIKPYNTPYEIILDRDSAIKHAIHTAKPQTVIAVLGKGSETNQAIGDGYVDSVPDSELVKMYLKDRK